MRRSDGESEYVDLLSLSPLLTSAFVRAVKMNLANEGLEARKKEEEVTARKRKAEDDARWEGKSSLLSLSTGSLIARAVIENREQRVDSWRNFSNTKNKKKKQKVAILG